MNCQKQERMHPCVRANKHEGPCRDWYTDDERHAITALNELLKKEIDDHAATRADIEELEREATDQAVRADIAEANLARVSYNLDVAKIRRQLGAEKGESAFEAVVRVVGGQNERFWSKCRECNNLDQRLSNRDDELRVLQAKYEQAEAGRLSWKNKAESCAAEDNTLAESWEKVAQDLKIQSVDQQKKIKELKSDLLEISKIREALQCTGGVSTAEFAKHLAELVVSQRQKIEALTADRDYLGTQVRAKGEKLVELHQELKKARAVVEHLTADREIREVLDPNQFYTYLGDAARVLRADRDNLREKLVEAAGLLSEGIQETERLVVEVERLMAERDRLREELKEATYNLGEERLVIETYKSVNRELRSSLDAVKAGRDRLMADRDYALKEAERWRSAADGAVKPLEEQLASIRRVLRFDEKHDNQAEDLAAECERLLLLRYDMGEHFYELWQEADRLLKQSEALRRGGVL